MLMSGCASVASVNPQTSDWEMSLEKGSRAPYSGVLVPDDAYRFYQMDAKLFPSCEERLRASVRTPTEEGWFTPRQLSFSLVGVIAGMLTLSRTGR